MSRQRLALFDFDSLLARQDCAAPASEALAIHPKGLALVERHLGRGDLCVVVPGRHPELAESEAERLGILLAEPEAHGSKLSCVEALLLARGLSRTSFEQVWAYCGSFEDIPLMASATHPVAVEPDSDLRAAAFARQWRVEPLSQRAPSAETNRIDSGLSFGFAPDLSHT